MRKRIPLKWEGGTRSNNNRLQLKPLIVHLKAHNVVQRGCFFLSLFSWTSRTNWAYKCSQVCYFKHMLGYTKWDYWSLTITKRILIWFTVTWWHVELFKGPVTEMMPFTQGVGAFDETTMCGMCRHTAVILEGKIPYWKCCVLFSSSVCPGTSSSLKFRCGPPLFLVRNKGEREGILPAPLLSSLG